MFDEPDYQCEVVHAGDPSQALDLARQVLLGQGFEITDDARNTLRAVGPGLLSTTQAAVLGASEIALRADGGRLVVQAQLGAARRMQRFVCLFPAALGLALVLAFALLGKPRPWLALGAAAPWVVVGPLMARWIERRTRRGLDALVHGIGGAARQRG